MPFIGPLEFVLLLIVGLPFYFVPSIIAAIRHHPNILPIGLINLLLGWTFLGWLGSFIWSVLPINKAIPVATPPAANTNALAIAQERFAKGEISSEEFDKIKSRLT